MKLQATTWQTVGPFFSIGLDRLGQAKLAGHDVKGERIQVFGRVFDGDLLPIPDAIVEIWQANSYGKYAHPSDLQDKPLDPHFTGHGRIPTDAEGCFSFETIKPGAVPGPEGAMQAPHLLVGLMMRGLMKRAVTRAYFPNEPLNAADPIFQSIPSSRRRTLLLEGVDAQPNSYNWNIHMQGESETVFLDF